MIGTYNICLGPVNILLKNYLIKYTGYGRTQKTAYLSKNIHCGVPAWLSRKIKERQIKNPNKKAYAVFIKFSVEFFQSYFHRHQK